MTRIAVGRESKSPGTLVRVCFFVGVLFVSLLGAACGEREAANQDQIYRPPTLAASPSPLITPTEQEPPIVQSIRPTATPTCVNNLRFIEDLSIPDGMLVSPGEELDKRWQVENNGTCNWEADYRVSHIAGPTMGVPAEQALYPALSGTQAVIRMIFRAPEEAGTYRSAWQAYDPQGIAFGDPIFIEVVVSDGTASP